MGNSYDPYRAINDIIKGVTAAGGHPHLSEADVQAAHRGATIVLSALGILPASPERAQQPAKPAPTPERPPSTAGRERRCAHQRRDVFAWIDKFRRTHGRLPYGREVGIRFQRTPRWGRYEVRLYKQANHRSTPQVAELWD